MTTKPDGWVVRCPRGEWLQKTINGPFVCAGEDGAWYYLQTSNPCLRETLTEKGYRIIPICLVPPALLDWCEEVEKFFQDELKWGMIEDPESVKKLVDKLKEVRK